MQGHAAAFQPYSVDSVPGSTEGLASLQIQDQEHCLLFAAAMGRVWPVSMTTAFFPKLEPCPFISILSLVAFGFHRQS